MEVNGKKVSQGTLIKGELATEILAMTANLSDVDRLAVMMVVTAKAVDHIVEKNGNRGRIVKAAKADFEKMLNKHVHFPGVTKPGE